MDNDEFFKIVRGLVMFAALGCFGVILLGLLLGLVPRVFGGLSAVSTLAVGMVAAWNL
jgi:hypothetical protein